jgi:uncharacterized membrane protein
VCSTVLSNFQEILINVSPFFLLLVVLFLGLYVFWRGCSETRKDTSSIFDVFTISLFLGLILGRISYVIANWSSFTSFIWYWLPYEKYGDEIYLFRVLPWRFFRVWDWGIDILTMFVGFLLVASLWVLLVKKWKWSHLFTTIFFTAQVMLAISFVLLGGVSGNEQWIIQGAVMMLLPAVLFFLKNSVKKIMIGNKEIRVLAILDVIFTVLTVIYTAYTYLAVEISDVEKGGVITFVVWTLLGTIYYLYDLRKDKVTIEKVSSVRVVSPVDVNQPVKLPQNEND